MKLDLLPHEGPLLAAGATALCRSVEKCCDSPRLACDGRTLACNGCYGELLSPFPPVGSECEAFGREYKPGLHAEKFRVRVTGLDVRRVNDPDLPWELCCLPLGDDLEDIDWWEATFPDAPFDKSFCWIATIERSE